MFPSYAKHSFLVSMVLALGACGTARVLDTSPSAVTPESEGAYSEPDYSTFVARWLGSRVKTVEPTIGAAAAHFVIVAPPARLGFNRVGGREIDESLDVFARWCQRHSGKLRKDLYFFVDGYHRDIPQVLGLPPSVLPTGAYNVCLFPSGAFAAIAADADGTYTDRPATVTLTHFTTSSAAEGRETLKRAAASEARFEAEMAADQRKRRSEANEALRRSLTAGTGVSWRRLRAMVIEVRSPIALIQFENATPGTRWVHIHELEVTW